MTIRKSRWIATILGVVATVSAADDRPRIRPLAKQSFNAKSGGPYCWVRQRAEYASACRRRTAADVIGPRFVPAHCRRSSRCYHGGVSC